MKSPHRHLRPAAAAAALGCLAALAAACSGGPSQAVKPAAKTTVTAAATPSPGSATPTPTPTASPTPAPTPPPTPTPSGPPICPTSALNVAIGPGNGAAGSTYYPLDFTNTASGACIMFGYPGVSFVTGVGGSQIGGAASRNPAFASESVTVPAGGVVHATLQVVNAANFPGADCHPVTAHWLKIYPPDQTAPLYLKFTAPACSRQAKPGSILAVETIRPGSS